MNADVYCLFSSNSVTKKCPSWIYSGNKAGKRRTRLRNMNRSSEQLGQSHRSVFLQPWPICLSQKETHTHTHFSSVTDKIKRDWEIAAVTFCSAAQHLTPPHVTQGWSTIKYYMCIVIIIIVSLFSTFYKSYYFTPSHTRPYTHTHTQNSSAQCLPALHWSQQMMRKQNKCRNASALQQSPGRLFSLWTRHAHSKVNINQEFQLMN